MHAHSDCCYGPMDKLLAIHAGSKFCFLPVSQCTACGSRFCPWPEGLSTCVLRCSAFGPLHLLLHSWTSLWPSGQVALHVLSYDKGAAYACMHSLSIS